MTKPKNILWIMCDQLRFDYLSCYGHPHLKTPHIDALAARGVRFTRTYVQSPVCGPSRMSFYTGRYMRSHGSNWNGFPLRVGEPTLGDALKAQGVRNVDYPWTGGDPGGSVHRTLRQPCRAWVREL